MVFARNTEELRVAMPKRSEYDCFHLFHRTFQEFFEIFATDAWADCFGMLARLLKYMKTS